MCLSCGSALGFSLDDMALLVITSGEDSEHGGAVDSSAYQLCANLHVAECNWLVKVKPGLGATAELCTSCKLTRVRPNDADTAALAAFAGAEKANRRLVVELIDLKLPIVSRDDDPQYGLAFDLLSSQLDRVVTGHHNGVITLNLAEGDDVHRERLRIAMDEPYRTLLGTYGTRSGTTTSTACSAGCRTSCRGSVSVRRPRRRLSAGAAPAPQPGRAAGRRTRHGREATGEVPGHTGNARTGRSKPSGGFAVIWPRPITGPTLSVLGGKPDHDGRHAPDVTCDTPDRD